MIFLFAQLSKHNTARGWDKVFAEIVAYALFGAAILAASFVWNAWKKMTLDKSAPVAEPEPVDRASGRDKPH